MGDAFTREVGRLEELDGSDIVFCVDRGRVVVDYGPPLDQDQAEAYAQMFARACWEAAHDRGLLSPAGCEADCGGPVHDEACGASGG